MKEVELHPRTIDMTGQKHGRIYVIGYSYKVNGKLYWKCRCDCGRVYYTTRTALLRCQSCGCERIRNVKASITERYRGDDMIGRVIGDYAILEKLPSVKGRRHWKCRCRCGNIVDVCSTKLYKGDRARCTCDRKKYTRRVSVSNATIPLDTERT